VHSFFPDLVKSRPRYWGEAFALRSGGGGSKKNESSQNTENEGRKEGSKMDSANGTVKMDPRLIQLNGRKLGGTELKRRNRVARKRALRIGKKDTKKGQRGLGT